MVTGYPKLDVYQRDQHEKATEPVVFSDARTTAPKLLDSPVIYAPHHSLGKEYLSMSTFDWSGRAVLDLAKQYTSRNWVYKPHPSLWLNVEKAGFMSSAEYSAYEQNWSNLTNAGVYSSGQYFDLFKTSSALLTCSGSFLAEYLPTGRPILWLRSSTTVGLNRIGARLSEGFYMVDSQEELQETFRRVVIEGDDPLNEVRQSLIKELFPRGGAAGREIADHLVNTLVP